MPCLFLLGGGISSLNAARFVSVALRLVGFNLFASSRSVSALCFCHLKPQLLFGEETRNQFSDQCPDQWLGVFLKSCLYML